MTVWLCSDTDDPADTARGKTNETRPANSELCIAHQQAVGHQLARHLITNCTEPNDLVVEAFTSSDAVLSAAVDERRWGVALVPHFPLAQHIGTRLRARHAPDALTWVEMRPTRPDQMHLGLADSAGAAALVIAAPPAHEVGGRRPKVVGQHECPACRADLWMLERQQLTGFLSGAWRTLRPGGTLAIITAACRRGDGRLHDPAPQIIARASRMGFVYTQHVIALRVPIEGDALAVQCHPGEVGQLRDTGSGASHPRVSIHADLCLFTKPESTTEPHKNEGGQDGDGR
ncbi:hypothetical protein [Actinomadura rupiterrae]|uniref:hypothetical protein n=1 Tax=Actinomadura rupiterrae TaxID=559627 RepID=UPI0020A336CB|nr:hypothetical protein [Actinomadura rupiterrae]MCP2342935.1 hypothetical protein [Actinomadura rupiterrae]